MDLLTVNIKQAGYAKDKPIISDVAFTIEAGKMVGLIGPNGAGKSTTIKTILGQITNWKGKVDFYGNKRFSYIPEKPIFYDELTLQEHINFVCGLEEMDEKLVRTRSHKLLQQFGLTQQVNDYPGTFSKGMQQKMLIVLALLPMPDIYIIDEPFLGLDPFASRAFLEAIDIEIGRGAAVLMGTHVLDTAEKVCDQFLVMVNGRLLTSGSMPDLRRQSNLDETADLMSCFHMLAKRDSI